MGFFAQISKLSSFPQRCFWSCLSASPHGGPSQPPAAPKHETVARLGAFLGRNSCKLSLWVFY